MTHLYKVSYPNPLFPSNPEPPLIKQTAAKFKERERELNSTQLPYHCLSYSGAESSMEETSRRRRSNGYRHHNSAAEDGDGVGDPVAWNMFADSFNKVQTVLDRNRALIQQANENHQSRIPDNMVKNVAIIQELNGNISKVASIYSDLSANFNGTVHQHRQQGGSSKGASRRE